MSHDQHDNIENEDQEEKVHWEKVISTLRSYKSYIVKDMKRRQAHLNQLPQKYADRLPNSTFDQMWAIDQAADNNQIFLGDVSFSLYSTLLYSALHNIVPMHSSIFSNLLHDIIGCSNTIRCHVRTNK